DRAVAYCTFRLRARPYCAELVSRGSCEEPSRKRKWEAVRDGGRIRRPRPLGLSGGSKIGRDAHRRRTCDPHVAECLIESGEACLVQRDVHAIAGVKALHIRLVAVPRRAQPRSAKRLRQVGGQTLIMLRMQVMLERMCGGGVLQAERMPTSTQREHHVKSTNLMVERANVGAHSRKRIHAVWWL